MNSTLKTRHFLSKQVPFCISLIIFWHSACGESLKKKLFKWNEEFHVAHHNTLSTLFINSAWKFGKLNSNIRSSDEKKSAWLCYYRIGNSKWRFRYNFLLAREFLLAFTIYITFMLGSCSILTATGEKKRISNIFLWTIMYIVQ